MGRKSSKKRINYNARLKAVRPFVRFDYDLRSKLSSGQKSAITKAFKEINAYKSKRYIPIPKRRSESKAAFKRRVKKIKRGAGQDTAHGRLTKGVFVDVPTGVKARVKEDKIKFYTDNFTDTFIPADYILLSDDPQEEAERVWSDLDFDVVAINYSGHGRSAGYDKRDDDGTIFEAFINEMTETAFRYITVLEHAISGYILRTYHA